MSHKKDISITINNQTHHFNGNDMESMRKLPWSERKALIALLENIKKAEYVKSVKTIETADESEISESEARSHEPVSHPKMKKASVASKTQHKLDSPIKSSKAEADVDDLMNRLIVEQKQTRSSVPDKSEVYKWLLLIVVVIFVLAMVF
ncbi:hypothetical protein OS175_01620 [Marinicella sp. S1101]|uniref:hypothetical protein n=1 Tax=Marinicella marina TaxID=2996016 RepID=UPI002260A84C|nr:hypothetical protein [Marinicella marina]MCX7552561.1 hypothetical protein [Marinicella marina]MDJ1139437.1 hypothetical protein [Marinicella marina]